MGEEGRGSVLCPQQYVPKGLLAIFPDEGYTRYNPAQPWSLWVPLRGMNVGQQRP